MSDIQTWEEMEQSGEWDDYSSMVREYTKRHVTAALEAACKNSKLLVINTEEHREIEDDEDLLDEYECGSDVIHISASSILNTYPLTNIK